MRHSLLLLVLLCAVAGAQAVRNQELLDIAADLEAGKDVTKKVTAFVKKHDDFADVMQAFKPTKNGGIGTKAATPPADGIEFKIYDLARKPLAKELLEKQKKDLLKIAALTQAMSKLTPHYEPTSLSAMKRAEWRKQQEAMGKAAADLAAAVRKGDPVAVRKAATGINGACIKCHDACR
jgi:hypothetical protein